MIKKTLKNLLIGFIFLSTLLSLSCVDPYGVETSETVAGWLVTHNQKNTNATKSLPLAAQTVTLSLTGSDIAINKVLTGEWTVGAGNAADETVIFSGTKDSENVEVKNREGYTLHFTVRFSTPQNKSSNIGGNLGPGNYVWFERTAVWWSAGAWTEPAIGDVDLYLFKKDWDLWSECDRSELDGLQEDDVAHMHGLGWQDYRVKVLAKASNTGNSIFTGQVSW